MSFNFAFRRRKQLLGSTPSSESPKHADPSRSAQGIPLFLQNKMDVTRPGDAAEQEADRFAAAGRKLDAGDATVVPSSTAPLIDGLLGDRGHPVAPDLRAEAEPMLGADLNPVRVHDSPASRSAAAQLEARAFTVGSDIWLGPGAREQDHALMSHELMHVRQQAKSGTPSLMRQSIASALPPSITPKSAALSFTLPGNRALSEELSTTNPTQVFLSVSPSGLQVSFSPALLISTPWYASDMEWSGISYDFTKGAVSSISLADVDFRPSGQSKARGVLTGKVTTVLAGTRMAAAGYDPVSDPDIMGTLGQIKSNFAGMGSGGGGGITAKEITGVAATVNLNIGTPIHQGTAAGAIEISGGVSLTARFKGSAADVAGSPEIDSIFVSGDSIVVQKDGKDVAQILNATIGKGGAVTIGGLKLLGSAKTAAGVESFFKLLIVAGELSQGGPEDRLALADKEVNLEAEIVPGLTRHMIQDALTQAIRDLISKYSTAIPGVDLNTVFGMQQKGDFPTGLPGETATSRFG